MTRRIAILVDGDNTSPVHAARIKDAAAAMGRVDLARVYGNAGQPSGWLTAPGFRMIHAGCGKNAADVLLCIEAMELALTGDWAGFVIASSDGDFVHLAQRLRDRGLDVAGIGEAKAPATFRDACASFIQITPVRQAAELPAISQRDQPTSSDTSQVLPLPTHRLRNLDDCILQMMIEHKVPAQGMRLTELNARMTTEFGFLIGAHEDKTWRAYFTRRPTLFSLDPPSQQARVRYRMKGFAERRFAGAIAAE